MQLTSCFNCLQGLVDLYLRLNVVFAIQPNDKASSLKNPRAYYVAKLDKDTPPDSHNAHTDYSDEELTLNIVNLRKLIYDSNI